MPADEGFTDIEQLLNEVGASTASALSQMASIQAAHKKLKSEFEAMKSKNAKLQQKVKKLQSENHALHIVREKLTAERAADREVIKMWQSRMNEQQAPPSELSTQENPVQPAAATLQIPSSPPVSEAIQTDSEEEEGHQYPLSQRVLPMSIGLSEPREIETEAEDPPTEMPIPDFEKKRTYSHREKEDKNELIEKLKTREWHPADFKLNPRYVYTDSRSKSERANLHASDCAECARFYELAKMDKSTKEAASRHRHALDQQDTPPGYWSMDFHGSSQLSQDKAAEKQYLHMTGQDRFEEAIAGGRYIFKDDSLNRQLGIEE